MLWEKFEAWPEPYKPPFSDIPEIGCCSMHEAEHDFDWYRSHNWQDLRDFIVDDGYMLSHPIDPFQFISLDPNVHRYYMKGVLSALARLTYEQSSFEDMPYEVWLWIERDKKDVVELQKLKNITTEYTQEEIGNIIELLEQMKRTLIIDEQRHQVELDTTLEYYIIVQKCYLVK